MFMSRGVLVYDYADHSVRTAAGTLIATCPTLDAAALAFTRTVFNIRNFPKD